MIDMQEHGSRLSSLWALFRIGCAVQFQKQGKDMERVKQRLAEIANYVDKVTIKSTERKWCWNVIYSSPPRINRPVSRG